jgi:hypothetical protein
MSHKGPIASIKAQQAIINLFVYVFEESQSRNTTPAKSNKKLGMDKTNATPVETK